MGTQTTEDLLKTPLHGLHVELGAKMVPFAGYDMPVQYKLGVLGEHLHTREKA
ncbi:MAG TPA: glycine cleavage system aminomethyltransferase GcvT, partial [Rhodobiaceae bacterium]|nr:glycine cleavage system aminomethyltransferase GcvT [Rhodobiaceae bacterium]